jgi:hypothetical protein
MLLTPENCPNVSQNRLDAVNAMPDSELRLEIEKGRASRFGETMQPVLRTALNLREEFYKSNERNKELSIGREANRIAAAALLEAKDANRKADGARMWSAIAVLVTVLLVLINFWSGQ